MPAPLRAVTFDVWQTLLHDVASRHGHRRTELRVGMMTSVLARAGVSLEEGILLDAYERLGPFCAKVWLEREFGPDEQLRWVIEQAAGPRARELDTRIWAALEAAYVDPVFLEPPDLAPDAEQAIVTAKQLGLKIGLICNTGYTPGYALRELFSRFGIIHLFDDLAFSNEEGLRKPSAELFRRVAGRLDVEPTAIAHVGDDVITDIAGSKAIGYRAVLIRPEVPESVPVDPDAFIRNLASLGDVLSNWL